MLSGLLSRAAGTDYRLVALDFRGTCKSWTLTCCSTNTNQQNWADGSLTWPCTPQGDDDNDPRGRVLDTFISLMTADSSPHVQTILLTFDNAGITECLLGDFAMRTNRQLTLELYEKGVTGILDCQVFLRLLTKGLLPRTQGDEGKGLHKFSISNCLAAFLIQDEHNDIYTKPADQSASLAQAAGILHLFRRSISLPTFDQKYLTQPSSWLRLFGEECYRFMPITVDVTTHLKVDRSRSVQCPMDEHGSNP